MTKPLYFYNGTTFEQVGPTTPQSPIAYQTSAPTGPATGDLWVDSDGDVDTYNRQLTRYYFVATAAQTTISGVDANSLTLAYVAGSEAVYVNGALQVRGQDYTATNGTSVVMSSALAVNDVVEIFAYTAFTVANAYTKAESDSLVGAAPGLKLLVPTSVAVGSGTASIGTAGQVTFSSASSVSLNGVFTSTYDNYFVIYQGSFTTAANTSLRLRSAGSDLSSALYRYAVHHVSTNADHLLTTGNTQTSGYIVSTNLNRHTAQITFFNPFLTAKTQFDVQFGSGRDATVFASSGSGTNEYDATTSVDAFTLIFSQTGTGTVSVYGYKV